MAPDLIKVTELYLIPASLLVGALGISQTEQLKTGVSALGLVSALLWAFSAWTAALPGQAYRSHILSYVLPLIFVFGWLVAILVHGQAWRKLRRSTR